MYEKCLRCGRKLTSAESQQLGYGATCNKIRLHQATNGQESTPALFDVIKDLQNQILVLKAEVTELKANSATMIQPTAPILTASLPPSPPMTVNPVKIDKVELANNAPTNLSQAFFEVQDDLKTNLAKLREIADETITSSLGSAEVKEEDSSGMDVLVAMQSKIQGDN